MATTSAEVKAIVDEVRTHFEKPMRVVLVDGRVVTGIFQSLDRETNIVLAGAMEYYDVKPDMNLEADLVTSRSLGYVVIPGKHVVRCESQTNY